MWIKYTIVILQIIAPRPVLYFSTVSMYGGQISRPWLQLSFELTEAYRITRVQLFWVDLSQPNNGDGKNRSNRFAQSHSRAANTQVKWVTSSAWDHKVHRNRTRAAYPPPVWGANHEFAGVWIWIKILKEKSNTAGAARIRQQAWQPIADCVSV